MALTQNSATIANGASTVIAVAALGISSRHNYIGTIRGKGIECPRTLANLKAATLPPSKAAFLLSLAQSQRYAVISLTALRHDCSMTALPMRQCYRCDCVTIALAQSSASFIHPCSITVKV